MTDHRTSTRAGTVYVAQRRVAIGMTFGVLAGVVWTVSMICTIVSWMF
ncbi:morphogenic membrane protein MmpA [Streptomyces sp. NPDC056352]